MAQVRLKDALTYSIHNRTFLKDQPLTITNPAELAYFRNNAHFEVLEDPKPVAPRKAVAKPAPEPEAEEETETEEVEEEQPEEAAAEEAAPEEAEALAGDPTEEEIAAAEAEEQPAPKPIAKKAPPARKGQFQKGGKRA